MDLGNCRDREGCMNSDNAFGWVSLREYGMFYFKDTYYGIDAFIWCFFLQLWLVIVCNILFQIGILTLLFLMSIFAKPFMTEMT